MLRSKKKKQASQMAAAGRSGTFASDPGVRTGNILQKFDLYSPNTASRCSASDFQ
jgi:hypothetical protein